ncbi:MAG: bile acid:sodium symporter family protein [Thermoguttaceae bacterium]|nr:bile acid:sodium symporter family protein [Thermoguttaceae bacterium]MDW8079622.1 bile acid:sodium symporter family protein [Thermoguttaceae bacterium]
MASSTQGRGRWHPGRELLFWLVVLSGLAFFWPDLFRGLPDPFLSTGDYLDTLIMLTMLAVGSLLPRDELEQLARRWPMVIFGTFVQYTTMPLLAFGTALAAGLPPGSPLMIGVLIVGAVPGAMASNVLTLLARGHVSYSISLTTLATLISPLMVPTILWLALSQWVAFPVLRTARDLTILVVLPVVTGYLLSRYWTWWQSLARTVGPLVANLAILWIIAVVVARNRGRLADMNWVIPVVLIVINLGGYLAGYLAAVLFRLPVSMRRALCLEIGMQNAGLGTVLALQLFGQGSLAAMPPALYTFVCMFTGTALARLWSRVPIREKLVDGKSQSPGLEEEVGACHPVKVD